MNMIPTGAKVELIRLIYELKSAAALFGAKYAGNGTALAQEERMEEIQKKITDMVSKL